MCCGGLFRVPVGSEHTYDTISIPLSQPQALAPTLAHAHAHAFLPTHAHSPRSQHHNTHQSLDTQTHLHTLAFSLCLSRSINHCYLAHAHVIVCAHHSSALTIFIPPYLPLVSTHNTLCMSSSVAFAVELHVVSAMPVAYGSSRCSSAKRSALTSHHNSKCASSRCSTERQLRPRTMLLLLVPPRTCRARTRYFSDTPHVSPSHLAILYRL